MRRFLLLCLLFLLPSCGPREPRVRAVDAAMEQGLLIRGNGAEPESLDPHLATSVSAGNVLLNLFEGLTRLNAETLQPEPGMAESWTVSEDGRTVEFSLREAYWSDGEPVTSSDFVFAFRRLLNPALGAGYAFMLYPVLNAEAVAKGERPLDELGVEAFGDRELRLRLGKPAPHLLALLAHWTAFPLPEHVLRKHENEDNRGGEWTRREHLVGNGAFTLAEWRSEELIRLRKNPRYWQADEVMLDAAEFRPVSDPGSEERAFRGGELHVTYTLPRHRLAHYREQNPGVLRVDTYLESVGYVVNLSTPALRDVRVREALSLALDRRAITEQVLYGVREPAFHFVPPGTGDYRTRGRLEENPDAARRLLAEAGYPGGEGFPEITFIYPGGQDSQRVAEVIQQQWQTRLGIRIRIDNLERQSHFSRRRERDFDLCFLGWVGDYVDPLTFLGLWESSAGNNFAGWNQPDYDALLQRAANAGERRMEVLAEAEALLLEELPILPLYFGATQYLKDPRVEGWHENVLDWHPLRAVRFAD
ncbi:MAG: peptide ABC transporter substrate-binding protein [Kiritimatiellia bacterium]